MLWSKICPKYPKMSHSGCQTPLRSAAQGRYRVLSYVVIWDLCCSAVRPAMRKEPAAQFPLPCLLHQVPSPSRLSNRIAARNLPTQESDSPCMLESETLKGP